MTGPVQLASGTVTAPGAVFAADPSSGLYKTTAGIGIAVGGVKVAEFTAAGIASGNRELGELVPFAGSSAPSTLWALPYGQTLSRTTYPAMWAFVQTEIAAGSTLYNNGDGSTTFGILDMRGRVPAGWDKMGGTAANRLTTAGSGVDGTTLGVASSAQTQTLLTANLPPYTPSGSVTSTGTAPITDATGYETGALNRKVAGGSTALSITSTFYGNAQGGTSTPFAIVQPTMVTNYMLFVGGAL